MPKARRKSRVYWRSKRAWADFRDYADVGGRQEPLISKGERLATTDRATAEELATERLLECKTLRANRRLTGQDRSATLAEFASEHLVQKAELDDVADKTFEAMRRRPPIRATRRARRGARPARSIRRRGTRAGNRPTAR